LSAYAKALADPFAAAAHGACIPDGKGGSTLKFSTRVRVLHTVGSTTPTAIYVCPTAATDLPSIAVVSNGESIPPDTAVPNTYNALGSAFSSADFGGGALEQRCVAWGVKVRNANAKLYQQGVSYGYGNMNLYSSLSANTNPSFYENQYAARRVPNGEWLVLRGACDDFNEATQWHTNAHLGGQSGSYAAGLPHSHAVIVVDNPATGNTMSDIELIAHWEVRGRKVTSLGEPNPTPSPAMSQIIYNAYSGLSRIAGDALSTPAIQRAVLHAVMQAGNSRLRLEL